MTRIVFQTHHNNEEHSIDVPENGHWEFDQNRRSLEIRNEATRTIAVYLDVRSIKAEDA